MLPAILEILFRDIIKKSSLFNHGQQDFSQFTNFHQATMGHLEVTWWLLRIRVTFELDQEQHLAWSISVASLISSVDSWKFFIVKFTKCGSAKSAHVDRPQTNTIRPTSAASASVCASNLFEIYHIWVFIFTHRLDDSQINSFCQTS